MLTVSRAAQSNTSGRELHMSGLGDSPKNINARKLYKKLDRVIPVLGIL